MANILYEIYLIKEDILQELLFDLDYRNEDENDEVFELRYIMDELLDIVWILANLYE